MSSEPPKPGAIPGWGEPNDASPTEPVPPPTTPAAPGTGWGQPPAPTEPAAPAAPAQTGWGQPPAPTEPAAPAAPAQTGWGQPPAPTEPAAPAAPAQTGWGQPPESAPPPSTPSASPPPASPPPQAPGQQAPPPGWGAPPPAGQVPPGQVPPGGGAPWNPAPPQQSNNGCLKACLIIGAILVVLFFIAVAGLAFLGNQIIKSVPIDEQGNLQPCPFVSNEELSSVLGSGTEAVPLQGFFDATLGLVLDKRVMPDDEDCWITSDGSTGTGRIARYQGPDAAAKFQAEKQAAQPTSQDQGNGLTIESEGYFAGDVSGLGDEAFCTGISTAIMEGVLVRQGDTLVYVSLLGTGVGPDLNATSSGVVTSDATCALAQEVAKAILQ